MADTDTRESLKDLARAVRCTARMGEAKLAWDKRSEWQKNTAADYRVTLSYQGRRMSCDWWQGFGVQREPDAASVLDALLSDASAEDMSFEEFCREYDYDTDSREAERTYKACQDSAKKVRRLLGDDFDLFRCYADRN